MLCVGHVSLRRLCYSLLGSHGPKGLAAMRLTNEMSLVRADGRPVVVYEFTEVIPSGTYGDPDATEDGLKSLRLESGGPVNFNPDGTFTIVATGEVLKR